MGSEMCIRDSRGSGRGQLHRAHRPARIADCRRNAGTCRLRCDVSRWEGDEWTDGRPSRGIESGPMTGQPTSPSEPVEPEVVDASENPSEAVDDDLIDESIEHPAKVMRVGTMMRQLLEEVRLATLDEPSRDRLREIYETSVAELGAAPVSYTHLTLPTKRIV